jgi:hypothetical protein
VVLRYCAESTNRTGTTDVKPRNVIANTKDHLSLRF